ncbi:SWIM zinc finger family protein [Sporosarcina jiandibaonis]|uniref:SWIM zinc finger family protein n=1 Tax=Sporosarcina jiandibaonis TaxID=2715535 RepID=UPI0015537542|nr:SWIM zinc finger family protein [Sporosarcina jiandibaonis]
MHMTVERVSYLHEAELTNFMNEIKHSFRSDIPEEASEIQKAVTLVRSGSVESYSYDSSRLTVHAEIIGKDLEEVTLSFGKLAATCTCEKPGWCSHRAAVIFHLYLQFNSLSDWMHEWRRMETEQMAFKITDRTPKAWSEVLSRLMNPIRIIGLNENPAVFIHKFELIDQKSRSLTPFEYEWKPLFDVYYRLHALEAAWPYIYFHLGGSGSNFTYGKWYVKNWLTDQLGKLADSVKSISSKPRLFETDPFHDQLKVLVRNLALDYEGLFDERFRVYQTFWQKLFTDKFTRQNEQKKLEDSDSPEASTLVAFFYVIQGQNEQLEELSKNITFEDFSKWLPLANLAERDDNMESLAVIMSALLPFIGDYLKQNVAVSQRPTFVRKIDGLLEAADFPEDEREKMFSYYGETGVDVYADFLVERGRFREWAALMHRYRMSYEVAEAGGLKIALAQDPAAVLPLLHVYATNFMKERNRQSYRRAVNLFRKMKAGSKKSGKHEFWNRYIDTVREKNRRLRALMEEMEKGNLYL